MRCLDTLVKCPLPCPSFGSFKMFKISVSEFCTVSMHRRIRACADGFLAMVTKCLVYKVVNWSSFGVTRRHKASGGKWMFCHCVTRSHTDLRW